MARNIPRNESQRLATKITLPSKALNQNGRQNQEFPRQKKAETKRRPPPSLLARDAKGSALRKGRKRVKERRTQV